jgi:hypothetical protein
MLHATNGKNQINVCMKTINGQLQNCIMFIYQSLNKMLTAVAIDTLILGFSA